MSDVDLVERLRNSMEHEAMCDEAADEITRLRLVAEIAEVMADNMIRDLKKLQETASEAIGPPEVLEVDGARGARELIEMRGPPKNQSG